ncbi:hypothetical protein L218DRAFT_606758 [Marasmius fiardii PR-910]|nr:hypothetical protein L218DRAFT_606758 [Marasmius fiardii PR-910]
MAPSNFQDEFELELEMSDYWRLVALTLLLYDHLLTLGQIFMAATSYNKQLCLFRSPIRQSLWNYPLFCVDF